MPEPRAALSALLVGVWCIAITSAGAQARQPSPVLDSMTVHVWAALLAVHDARSQDTVAIDNALASPLPQLRAAAARVVGMNRVATRFPVLRTLLEGRDTSVARDAAFALGLAGDSASCAALGDAIERSTTGVAAAWALGEVADRCGSFDRLFVRARTPAVRAALLRVAGKWAPFPDSTVRAAHRNAVSADERWAALYALARARRPAGAGTALVATRAPAARVRDVAARLLSASLIASGETTAVMRRLTEMLRDPHPHVRIAAVRSIATYPSTALSPLRQAWTVERDVNVRVAMAQVVGTVATDTATVWADWWLSDTSHMVRRSLIASAWQVGAIGPLERALDVSLDRHPDYRIRMAMIDGAATDRTGRHFARVTALTADQDPRVRASLIAALGVLPAAVRDTEPFRSLVVSAGIDDDIGVRRAALGLVSRAASAADAAMAVAAYVRAIRDSSRDARDAALTVVASAWRRDSTAFPDSVVAALRALDPSPDPLLREHARGVTPLAHWSAVAAAGPAVRSDYERIVREVIVPALRGRAPMLTLLTDRGPIRITLDGVQTPMTADHLSRLARRGYFRDLRFHRVVPAFVAQGGDPRGDGSGGPGFAIRDELNRAAYERGAVGMALSGPDTGGSQFFLTLAPQHHLDGHYTVFGRVTAGFQSMDALVQGDAIRNIIPSPE
ncbi:MAG: peptidylprolyl isomerase [Gemmatimonadaceae bacterium]|nr:peptidylprolyl isomerase [Gemmatimonadaceae bacterium]